MYNTIGEIRTKNKKIGRFFFSPATMRYFNSNIESSILKGYYFITSERREMTMSKRYTIRRAMENGEIKTIGDFRQFATKEGAKDYLKTII